MLFVTCISTAHETGDWRDITSQLSSDTGLIPRAWGQEVGLEDKSHFSMHMSAASIHFAAALTLLIQRAFIQKQHCKLRFCCTTGSVRPQHLVTSQPPNTHTPTTHSWYQLGHAVKYNFLITQWLFSTQSGVIMLNGEEQRGDLWCYNPAVLKPRSF